MQYWTLTVLVPTDITARNSSNTDNELLLAFHSLKVDGGCLVDPYPTADHPEGAIFAVPGAGDNLTGGGGGGGGELEGMGTRE